MRFTRNWALSLFVTMMLAAPVAATPPQVVIVQDRLFAITATDVIILREITDNHGYHQTLQTDTFLIIRDLATGRERDQVAVERVVSNSVVGFDTTHYPLENAYDPYTIRRNMNAAPLSDPSHMYLNVQIWDDAVRALEHDGERSHYARWNDIIPLAATSLQRTRDLLPVLKMEGDVDYFDPYGFLQPAGCEINAAMSTEYISDVDVMLVQLACEDEDFGGPNLIWFVLPADKG